MHARKVVPPFIAPLDMSLTIFLATVKLLALA